MQQFFSQPKGLPFLETRTTLDSVLPYDEHFHTHFSVGLILEGKTRFFLNGDAHLAQKGDIVLIAQEQVHSCNPINEQPRSYHMLFFEGTWFEENVPASLWDKYKINTINPVITDPNLFSQGLQLVTKVHSYAIKVDIILHWLSKVLAQAKTIPQTGMALITKKMTSKMLSLQTTDMSCSITSLATKAHMRRESYSRLVRKNMGLPPQACLHCLRIEKGRLLLRQGKTIAEAALETGYADQSHFHRMFRRIVCATPGCYQKIRSHPYNT